jgi:glycosyltransferase involved in cell wall biosynthesis
MRIAFLLSSFRLSGGVRVVVEYANWLARQGHEVHLLAPGGGEDSAMSAEIHPEISIKTVGPGGSAAGLMAKLVASWRLALAVPKVDLLISTHTPTTAAAWLAGRLGRTQRLIWLYQDYREMFIDRPVEDWLLRHALGWHDLALTVSASSRDELLTYVPSGQAQVVGEGLSHAEHFYPEPKPAQPGPELPKTLLFLGDMRPRKGLYDILAAAEHLREHDGMDIRLQIVSKEDCQFETPVPYDYVQRPDRQELADLYRACDVFVSASWWESFGLPPLEAMACGAAVVTTDSRGVHEYAEPGVNCLMVPPRDPQALAGAIKKLLVDPELAARLKEAAPVAAARFTWEAAFTRFRQALLAFNISV